MTTTTTSGTTTAASGAASFTTASPTTTYLTTTTSGTSTYTTYTGYIPPPVIKGIAVVARDIIIDPFVFSGGGFQPVAHVDVGVALGERPVYAISDSVNITLTYWLELPHSPSLPKYVVSYVQKYDEIVTYTLIIPVPAPGEYIFVVQGFASDEVSQLASQKFTVPFTTFCLGTFLIVAIIATVGIVGVIVLRKRKLVYLLRRMRSS